jgi:peroxiredoxin
MKTIKLFLIISLISTLFFSCGKKEQVTDKQEKKDNNTGIKKDTDNKQSSETKLFSLKSASNPDKKGDIPDIKWVEDGKTVSTGDLKGKVILINFWATWCKPCVGELPDLSKIYVELKDKGFEMLGISVMQENGGEPVNAFIKHNYMPYKIIEGNEDVVKAFSYSIGEGINSIPRTFIIDKTGKIVEKLIGVKSEKNKEHIQELVEKYLK